MPAYPGSTKAKLLMPGDQGFLFSGEQFAAGTASVAYMLDHIARNSPFQFAVQLALSGAPGVGTFEFDVEGAEVDSDPSYVQIGKITAVNANNAARFDGSGLYPKFVRGRIVNVTTNPVNLTMILSR